MRCPSCNSKVSRSQTHCPSCGEPLIPMAPSFGGAAIDTRPTLGYAPSPAELSAQGARRPHPALIAVIVVLALLAAGLVAWLILSSYKPGNGLALDDGNFPDAAFRAVVATYDADDDGALNADELASIVSLDCSDRDIASLEGIAKLTGLTDLNAKDNNLVSADLTANTALQSVNLSGCRLAGVSLTGLSNLVRLDVSGNNLASLDLTGCNALESLSCASNSIARLDLSACPNVTDITMDRGQNVTIPIAQGFFPDEGLRASLAIVDSDGDGALSQRERESTTTFTVSDESTSDLTGIAWLTGLTTLDVSNTALTRLTSGILPSTLTTLRAASCKIESVDLSSLPLLISLDVRDNPLTSLDLSPVPTLTSLDASGTSLSKLDITPCAAAMSTLRVPSSCDLTGGVACTSKAFPDEKLRSHLFSSTYNPNGDDLLTASELGNITSLDLSGSGVTDLRGLSALPNLTSLTCTGLSLKSFSVAELGLGNLQYLELSRCSLETISLDGAEALLQLDLSDNDLAALTVTSAAALESLDVTGNASLRMVDVRGCAALAEGAGVSCDEACAVVSTDEELWAWEEAAAQEEAAQQAAAEEAQAALEEEQTAAQEGQAATEGDQEAA